MVNLEPASSSNVAAMGYDEDNEQMIVEFNNGAQYAYPGVSFSEYEAVKDASSVGAALAKYRSKGVRI